MVVRQAEDRIQIAVLEDGVLVEHYVTKGASASMVGNVYLGRVQNVLPSMEAAFVDIGRGRNAVLYAGEVNWDAVGLEGQPKRIEFALKSGDPVLVQITKDPVGQKGARLTSQISLPGRFLVYVPHGSMTGPPKARPRMRWKPTSNGCKHYGRTSRTRPRRRHHPNFSTANLTWPSRLSATCSMRTSQSWSSPAIARGGPSTRTSQPSHRICWIAWTTGSKPKTSSPTTGSMSN